MANVIGRTQGYTKNGAKAGEATRLGSESVRSEANTWRTFVRCETAKDGSVHIQIKRDGQNLAYVDVNPEGLTADVVRLLDVGSKTVGTVCEKAREG